MELDSDSEDEYYVDHLDDLHGETLVELDSARAEESVEKKKKKVSANFDIPGVVKVILNELTQTSLGLEVGKDVTGEYSWTQVNKELLYDNISVLGDDSPFSYYKPELDVHEDDEVLFGYIHDDLKVEDEFYVCLTKDAKDYCKVQAEKLLRKQNKKLDKYLYKSCGKWNSLGSEAEVEQAHVIRSRPLIQMEYVSERRKSPIKLSPSNIADGCVSMIPERENFDIVWKKRVDVSIQAIPEKISSEAQTVPKFPQHTWTQCSLEAHEVYLNNQQEIDEDMMIRLKEFLDRHIDNIESIVKFNATIDIYNMDYPSLARKSDQKETSTKMEYYDSLINENNEDKMISCADWHYFWEDILAVSYAESVKYLPVEISDVEKDEVNAIVFDHNLVLIWSIKNRLKPKLYLECDREVKTVSFCPFDENIVIGGCVNGQVVVWNIQGRLGEVGEINCDEEGEGGWLEGEMGWSRNIHDRAVLRPIAVSDIKTCHFLEITAISWIDPNAEFTKFGKLTSLPETRERSKQFLTISLDGNIMIWDYNKLNPPPTCYEHQIEKFKTIKAQHPDLKLYDLPETQTDRNFTPIYKITVGEPDTKKVKPLTCIFFQTLNIENDVPLTVWLGTLYGDVMKISWKGQPPESDLVSEYCDYSSTCSIHNGSVLALERSPFFNEIYASVGGRILAVWSEKYDKGPLFWKSLNRNMTDIKWSPYIPSQMFIATEGGRIEVWDFFHRSDAPFKIEDISGSPLMGMFIHRLPAERNVMAIADSLGALRLYILPQFYTECEESRMQDAQLFFDREIEVKERYQAFQAKWFEKHAEQIEAKKKLESEKAKERERKLRLAKIKEQELREAAEQEIDKTEKSKSSNVEHEERWRRLQWKYAESVIQDKKMMNKSKLLKQEKPLQELLTHIGKRSQRVEDYAKRNKKVFEDSVAIFFPEMRTERQETLIITPLEEIAEKKAQYMREYHEICEKSKEFLENNPLDQRSATTGTRATRWHAKGFGVARHTIEDL